MHSVLRPELRAAHRILRAIRSSPSTSSRPVTRSFSSFRRLQSQSSPTDPFSPSAKGPSKDDSGHTNSPVQYVHDLIEELKGSGKYNNADTSAILSDLLQRADQEKKLVESAIARGEIPTGYTLIEDAKDAPNWLLKARKDKIPATPFLIPDHPAPFNNVVALPKDFQQSLSSTNSKDDSASNANHALTNTSNGLPNTTYYGSVSARRKRARETKSQTPPIEQIPSWFLNSNVILSAPNSERIPGVLPVRQSKFGGYIPATADWESGETAHLTPGSEGSSSSPPETGEREYAHGTGPKQPPSEGDAQPNKTPIPTHDVQNHVTLSDNRYFIQDSQYEELLDTFRGRLNNPVAESKLSDNPLALNHLTINHCAQHADTLLDTLVADLCHTTGADRIRLDIQDISDLIAQADVSPRVARDASKMSFKIYQEIYGPSTPREDDAFGMGENENENEHDEEADDDDASGQPSMPMGIGISGVAFSKDMFSRLSRSLNRSGGQVIELLDPRGDGGKSVSRSSGLFGNLVETMLSSRSRAHDEQDAQTREDSETAASADTRPLVIHLANYRALQDHLLTQGFLSDILHYVRRSSSRIMVVGTDSAREDQKSLLRDPKSILDEQNNKSYGLSSNILLTPVFPNHDAEFALMQDRENRIRNINARHLWRVLQAKGVSIKGLEAGFWSKDYKSDIAHGDWYMLSDGFWPFLKVQRLAALIAGQEPARVGEPSPITSALVTMNASDRSKQEWAMRNQPLSQVAAEKEQTDPINNKLSKIRSKASRHEKKLLSGVIEPQKITTTFKDIHIPAETIDALQTLTTLSLIRPDAFRYGVLKSDRIPGLLLYGPPGTGKTLAAKAVAKESGATMLEVSAADLNNMYVGEGEKNVQALFSLAKKLSPCVVFLDEADAMFSARSNQGRRVSHRELLNQFLKEWDGMSNDSGSAFIMVATNRPMDLDDAVLRRLPRRILVDLPTENDRLEILKIHLRHESLDDQVNLPELAKKTPFYSGSDLKNVAVAAALNAVREENEIAKKYRLDHPDSDTPPEYPEKRVLTKTHFDKALEEISASISEDMSSLKEIKKFDEQYGDRKGRKRKAPRWGFKSASEADRVLETVKVRS